MKKNILTTLAVSAVLAGCSSLGGSGDASPMHNKDCPGDQAARAGYVGGAAGTITLNAGGELLHGPGWSEDDAFHECEGILPEPEPEPEPAPEPEPEIEPTPVTLNVPVKLDSQALFALNSAEIGNDGEAALDSLAAGIGELDVVRRIVVVGHTDSTGSEEYNQSLSEKRAQSVADYLRSKLGNVEIAAVGRGETKPVAGNDTALGRAKNRRVEVVVIGNKTETQ